MIFALMDVDVKQLHFYWNLSIFYKYLYTNSLKEWWKVLLCLAMIKND